MAERKPRAKKGWQPIATLPDKPTTQMVLWCPCDGVHLVSLFYTPGDMERVREGEMFSHWRELEGPK